MSERLQFLFELGVEEIPHWMLKPAMAELARLFGELCKAHQVEAGAVKMDATPRRLVLRTELPARQADRHEIVTGPRAPNLGYGYSTQELEPERTEIERFAADSKELQDNPAVQGFLRKQGYSGGLFIHTSAKGRFWAYDRLVEGRLLRDILAESLGGLIAKIPWPKAMYWTGKGGQTFIRPVRWIVALLGDGVVEFEFAGVKSGAVTNGHRRMGKGSFEVDHASYETLLEKNGVILAAERRRKRIVDGIKKLIRGKGVKLVADESLLDDLVYLTEYPTPILGNFDGKFLDLPQEVLSTVMRHHQRYFTLQTSDGKMAPHFIAIMNIKADRKGYVVKGNERVLEARFNDGRFFWEVDRQRSLASRVDDLKAVTFQAKLGSYFDKSAGVREGVTRLAPWLGLDLEIARRAATLCKVDLMTEMVKELTELQGVMGGLYARADGEKEEVARAIYEHYLPQSMEDPIPASAYGQLLSVADKLDTLEGCFGIGMIPTGSKDPFALRRAAQGVVKVLVEAKLKLNLKKAIDGGMEQTGRVLSGLAPADAGAAGQLWEFMLDRIRYYFREVRGFAYDEVNAVLAGRWETLPDVCDRLYALKLVRQTENFEPLAASFKRIGNILKQAGGAGGEVREELLEAGPEQDLYREMGKVLGVVRERRQAADYIEALTAIATLRGAVDAFFDKILVNAPDAAVRANRLALLGRLQNEVSSIADFSEIVTSSTSE